MQTLLTLALFDIAGWLALHVVLSRTEEFTTPRIFLVLSMFAVDFWLFVAFVAYFVRLG